MQSSSGAYFVGLDHLRALAAFLVFQWHFIHGLATGVPVPFGYAPTVVPLSILSEGHCGVSLFMCLSGYLFAKLLDGTSFSYPRFLWNRGVRLLPLLLIVIVIVGLRGGRRDDPLGYLWTVFQGLVMPTLPNGGWSLTAEFHFYLVLPLILYLIRRNPFAGAAILLAAIAIRTALFFWFGEIQFLSYWTIVGRIDQFVLGITAFYIWRNAGPSPAFHWLMLAAFVAFAAVSWALAQAGGFYATTKSSFWIFFPAIDGLFFALLIAWYDRSFRLSQNGVSWVVAQIGMYSYSIYLTHFFYVGFMARTYSSLVPSSNFYLAILAGCLMFVIAAALSGVSYHLIEAPFFRFRKKYFHSAQTSVKPIYQGAL
jgi:peptidoglycan/LPS O-acetylase OafA/YrhL